MIFQETIQALTDTIVHDLDGDMTAGAADKRINVTRFVMEQYGRMPEYLKFPIKALTLAFDYWPLLTAGRPFHKLPHDQRARQVEVWRQSVLGPRKNLIKFFYSLVVFGWYSENYPSD